MTKFWEFLFSFLFGYGQVELDTGYIIFSCPNVNGACIKCAKNFILRGQRMGHAKIANVRHDGDRYEPIAMKNDDAANKIFGMLLGVWQSVLPSEFIKHDSKHDSREFNLFLIRYVWGLRPPSLDEKVPDIPKEETDPDDVNVPYDFIKVSKLFVKALTTDVNKAALRKLGMPDNIL
jgi:hypothetical protein